MSDQVLDLVGAHRRTDQMVVVQHEDDRTLELADGVHDSGDDAAEDVRRAGLGERAGVGGDVAADSLKRGCQLPPEPGRIIVAGVQADPGDQLRRAGGPGPLGHQG